MGRRLDKILGRNQYDFQVGHVYHNDDAGIDFEVLGINPKSNDLVIKSRLLDRYRVDLELYEQKGYRGTIYEITSSD